MTDDLALRLRPSEKRRMETLPQRVSVGKVIHLGRERDKRVSREKMFYAGIAMACGLSVNKARSLLSLGYDTIQNIKHDRCTDEGIIAIGLEPGEEQLAAPRRCETCGASLLVVPCRTCRERANLKAMRKTKRRRKRRSKP